MVPLEIDERTYAALRECATARGVSVEEWIRLVAADDAGEATPVRPRLSRDEYMARLRAIGDANAPTVVPVDDSRESIYD
jgi:hypothetical protein